MCAHLPWLILVLEGGAIGVAEAARVPKDSDGDGVPNSADACRDAPESDNGFQDGDGCPDELPTIRFVATFHGETLPDAVLTVQRSDAADSWSRGAFEAQALPGVMYSVHATNGDCLSGDLKAVHKDTDRTVDVALAMRESAAVIVEPFDAEGGWLSGVEAFYDHADPLCPSARFPVERDAPHKMAEGTYTLRLVAPGNPEHRWTVDLIAGRESVVRPVFGVPLKLRVDAAGARVWVGYPVSRWFGAQSAALSSLPAGTEARVEAPGRLPTEVILNGSMQVKLPELQREGAVILEVGPADAVQVDGEALPLTGPGRARVRLPRGKHRLTTEGGGRLAERELEVVAGRVHFVRQPVPEAFPFLYSRDRVNLGNAGRKAIEKMARHRGPYRFAVVPYMPREGNPDFDHRLATQRAMLAHEALLAAGVPAEAVEVRDPLPPFTGTAAEQRRIEIVPLAPE